MSQAAAIFTSSRGNYDMLKHYIKTREALMRLRTDKDGVVSLEYVIVGACVFAVVLAAFQVLVP